MQSPYSVPIIFPLRLYFISSIISYLKYFPSRVYLSLRLSPPDDCYRCWVLSHSICPPSEYFFLVDYISFRLFYSCRYLFRSNIFPRKLLFPQEYFPQGFFFRVFSPLNKLFSLKKIFPFKNKIFKNRNRIFSPIWILSSIKKLYIVLFFHSDYFPLKNICYLQHVFPSKVFFRLKYFFPQDYFPLKIITVTEYCLIPSIHACKVISSLQNIHPL